MIPTVEQAKQLWDKYHLPDRKRIHVQLVANVALFLSSKLTALDSSILINNQLLEVGALLHDIDKAIVRLPGETHPQTGVRVLLEEGFKEVAELIKFHSVQFIDDPGTEPKTWEEKLLFLSDKMVKQEIITVDKRFSLWLDETDLPEEQKDMLRRVYPNVKRLEQDIFDKIGIKPEDVAQLLMK
jgi:uncharacterized protein